MPKSITVMELLNFKDDFTREVLVDLRSRPQPADDKMLLVVLMNYGNQYLQKAIEDPDLKGARFWFDIHFDNENGDAITGCTWAYNPEAPEDPITKMDFFWRLWTETLPTDEYILPLKDVQELMADYLIGGATGTKEEV